MRCAPLRRRNSNGPVRISSPAARHPSIRPSQTVRAGWPVIPSGLGWRSHGCSENPDVGVVLCCFPSIPAISNPTRSARSGGERMKLALRPSSRNRGATCCCGGTIKTCWPDVRHPRARNPLSTAPSWPPRYGIFPQPTSSPIRCACRPAWLGWRGRGMTNFSDCKLPCATRDFPELFSLSTRPDTGFWAKHPRRSRRRSTISLLDCGAEERGVCAR